MFYNRQKNEKDETILTFESINEKIEKLTALVNYNSC